MSAKELTKKQIKKQMIKLTEGSIQMKSHLTTAYNAMKSLDKISTGQKIKNEKGENVTVTPGDNAKILAAMRKVEDVYRDIIGGEIKDKEDKLVKAKSKKTSKENEKSEGYGKMPSEIGENVVKLSQKTLKNVISRVILEREKQLSEDSEGEETYHYGEDEGEDRKEEEGLEREKDMSPHDRIGEIERHLDALKKDMSYDEDREDREEEGTDFE